MDCFISYSHTDSSMAKKIHQSLTDLGISAFLAEISLRGGDDWSDEIWSNLRGSQYVVFLASEASCRSPFVLQELGGARYDKKKIIPVVWDMSPSNLPGWVNQSHAVDLRGKDPSAAIEQFTGALAELKDGNWDLLKVILAVVAFVVLTLAIAQIATRKPTEDEDPLACPNCTRGGTVFRMSPVPPDFKELVGATHECTNCGFKTTLASA